MNVYHLEHPKYPRDYRFELRNSYVLVERWDGSKRLWVKLLSRDNARRLYKYLHGKVGYREFGYSTRKEAVS